MLLIERIHMQMPDGFGPRAPAIARLVGDYMADIHFSESAARERLTIGLVQVSPGATDEEIAQNIAEQIVSALGR